VQSGMEPNENRDRGTPTHASRNAHAFENPSRRDDIEAFLFLLADLLSCVSRQQRGSYLPWSQYEFEHDILEEKKAQVLDRESALYLLMSPEVADVIFKCLKAVDNHKPMDMPNYELLRSALPYALLSRSPRVCVKTELSTLGPLSLVLRAVC
jgi:hypothetical protein